MKNKFETYANTCLKELYDNCSELWTEVTRLGSVVKEKTEETEDRFQVIEGKLHILFKEGKQ